MNDPNHAQLRHVVQDYKSALLYLKQQTRKGSSCSRKGKEAAINTFEEYVMF